MWYRRPRRLPRVRFDAGAAAVINAAAGDPDGVWLVYGDSRRSGHPVLDRASLLVVDRDRSRTYDGVLLLCAGPLGTTQLRTLAVDVPLAVVAVVVAVTAHVGGPVGLSCGSHRQAAQIRRLLMRVDTDSGRRPYVHTW